jgi:hypothetical protein
MIRPSEAGSERKGPNNQTIVVENMDNPPLRTDISTSILDKEEESFQ